MNHPRRGCTWGGLKQLLRSPSEKPPDRGQHQADEQEHPEGPLDQAHDHSGDVYPKGTGHSAQEQDQNPNGRDRSLRGTKQKVPPRMMAWLPPLRRITIGTIVTASTMTRQRYHLLSGFGLRLTVRRRTLPKI